MTENEYQKMIKNDFLKNEKFGSRGLMANDSLSCSLLKCKFAFAKENTYKVLEILTGYRVLTYKGPMLAMDLYVEPWRRISGDIDVIVHPDDMDEALYKMGKHGYVYNGGTPIGKADYCMNYQGGHPDMALWHSHAGELHPSNKCEMTVEFHVTPFKTSYNIEYSKYREIICTMFDHCQVKTCDGHQYKRLGHTDELIALSHHFAKHMAQLLTVFNCSFYRGVLPLNLLCEIAAYIEKYQTEIDVSYAQELIRTLNMENEFRFVNKMLQFCFDQTFPFEIPHSNNIDEWERLFASIIDLDIPLLLQMDSYKVLTQFKDIDLCKKSYDLTSSLVNWVLVDEAYKFAGAKPENSKDILKFEWAANREKKGLRVYTKLSENLLHEEEEIDLRIQIGGEICNGQKDCLKNYVIKLFKKDGIILQKSNRLSKRLGEKSAYVELISGPVVKLQLSDGILNVDALFVDEHRCFIPFNIGISLHYGQNHMMYDSPRVVMWIEQTRYPFSCLFLGTLKTS